MSQTGECLVLYQDAAGPRHYLDGRPVHADAELELWTPFGWTKGTYGAIWRDGTIGWPRLATGATELLIRPDSLLRWPG